MVGNSNLELSDVTVLYVWILIRPSVQLKHFWWNIDAHVKSILLNDYFYVYCIGSQCNFDYPINYAWSFTRNDFRNSYGNSSIFYSFYEHCLWSFFWDSYSVSFRVYFSSTFEVILQDILSVYLQIFFSVVPPRHPSRIPSGNSGYFSCSFSELFQ